ncbi:hypothetical protein PTT_12561 [Pyrenophora teres f. teres 0-1]|uniref:Uncharacterized protein n=1 Tax=Pyrenophora teres f. teres (strain 0-1) TaxID=861557 RepID=E3RU24_PYRTT|nr:hypothetical protein PTT_12561 [Pyrenophora teres f. teres 0-1]
MAPHHPQPHSSTRLFGDNPALDYEDAIQEERKIRAEIDVLENKIRARMAEPEGKARVKAKGQRKEETLKELAKQFEKAEKAHLEALKRAPTASNSVGSAGSANGGSSSASRPNTRDTGTSTTLQFRFDPETNTADMALASTIRKLGKVPKVFEQAPAPNGGQKTYKVTLQWAIAQVGEDEFRHDGRGPRKILWRGSDLRWRGVAVGLKPEMLAWLTDSSASEYCVFDDSVFESEDTSPLSNWFYSDRAEADAQRRA